MIRASRPESGSQGPPAPGARAQEGARWLGACASAPSGATAQGRLPRPGGCPWGSCRGRCCAVLWGSASSPVPDLLRLTPQAPGGSGWCAVALTGRRAVPSVWLAGQHQASRFAAEFATYLNFCRSLRFDDKPDYSYLRQLFRNLFHRQGFSYDYVFDWNMLKFVSAASSSCGVRAWGPVQEAASLTSRRAGLAFGLEACWLRCSRQGWGLRGPPDGEALGGQESQGRHAGDGWPLGR